MRFAAAPASLGAWLVSQVAKFITAFFGVLNGVSFTSPRATYILRSILAASLALVVAYWLDLEMPYSAASTVLLVINPIQGAVIGKGVWRVLGTVVGMVVAILLMGAFAQMPWLFLLGFGLWLGVSVAGMTLLRHFRASGSVVAGYTVGLATFGAMQHPHLTFDHVVGRGSTVLLGVACLGLVSALCSQRGIHQRLEGVLRRLASDVAESLASQHQVASAHEGAAPERVPAKRRALISEVYGVDDLLALGKAESAELAQRAHKVRQAMVSLFAALVGGVPTLHKHSAGTLAWRSVQSVIENVWSQAARLLAQGPQGVEPALQLLKQGREQLLALLEQSNFVDGNEAVNVRINGERLIEQLDDYVLALEGMAALHQPRSQSHPRMVAVRFHRDTTAAVQNGLRAMLTLVLAGAFWFITGWPHGDMMLLVLAPYCALLATAGNPAAGAVEFVKGTVVAVPMAFLCSFVVLPHVNGLPLLLVVLALFWLPGIYATSLPKYGLAGLAYLVGFNTLAAVENPMHYHLDLFLNWSLAWVLATLFTLLGFKLLFPRNVARDAARLRTRIRTESTAVLKGKVANGALWQMRQQHRIAQLGAMLKTQPELMDQAIAEALTGLHKGREWFRLRRWLQHAATDSPISPIIKTALKRMAHRADEPRLAARHARRAAYCLQRVVIVTAEQNVEQQRGIAALLDLAELLEA
ncbi:FUSC family protein [Paenalcaligenes sp. Me131]|uniref:FUSC family protein n=1 Tax=Paenalcaligenes sp. Me131 TaxID=3392636 RepID=UPI003D29457C